MALRCGNGLSAWQAKRWGWAYFIVCREERGKGEERLFWSRVGFWGCWAVGYCRGPRGQEWEILLS